MTSASNPSIMSNSIWHFTHRNLHSSNMLLRIAACRYAYVIPPSCLTACIMMSAWTRAGIDCCDVSSVASTRWPIFFQFSDCQANVANTRLISSCSSKHSSCQWWARARALHHSTFRANKGCQKGYCLRIGTDSLNNAPDWVLSSAFVCPEHLCCRLRLPRNSSTMWWRYFFVSSPVIFCSRAAMRSARSNQTVTGALIGMGSTESLEELVGLLWDSFRPANLSECQAL